MAEASHAGESYRNNFCLLAVESCFTRHTTPQMYENSMQLVLYQGSGRPLLPAPPLIWSFDQWDPIFPIANLASISKLL
jgi:hypothetical protein